MQMIDRDLLVTLCEGNDSTVELCAELLEVFPDADWPELAEHFADRLRAFYDPDNGQTEEEHYENNLAWGEDIFEGYFEEFK